MAGRVLTPEQMDQMDAAAAPRVKSHQPGRVLTPEQMDQLASDQENTVKSYPEYKPRTIPSVPEIKVNPLESALVSAGNYFNLIPQLRGSLAAISDPTNARDAYIRERDQSAGVIEESGKQNPGSSFIGGIAGNIPLAMAGGSVPLISKLSGPSKGALEAGLKIGGLSALGSFATNPGEKKGEIAGLQLGDRAQNAAIGGLTGLVLGSGGKYIANQAKTSDMAKWMREKPHQVQEFLRDKIDSAASSLNQNVIGPAMRGARNAAENVKIQLNPDRLKGFDKPKMNFSENVMENIDPYKGVRARLDKRIPQQPITKAPERLDIPRKVMDERSVTQLPQNLEEVIPGQRIADPAEIRKQIELTNASEETLPLWQQPLQSQMPPPRPLADGSGVMNPKPMGSRDMVMQMAPPVDVGPRVHTQEPMEIYSQARRAPLGVSPIDAGVNQTIQEPLELMSRPKVIGTKPMEATAPVTGREALILKRSLDKLNYREGASPDNIKKAKDEAKKSVADLIRRRLSEQNPEIGKQLAKAEAGIDAKTGIKNLKKRPNSSFSSKETSDIAAAFSKADEQLGSSHLMDTLGSLRDANRYNRPLSLDLVKILPSAARALFRVAPAGLGGLAINLPEAAARKLGGSVDMRGIYSGITNPLMLEMAKERAKNQK